MYQGDNEIGSYDAADQSLELRILGVGVGAEIGSAVALELNGRLFTPLHDLQGNVACLIDSQTGTVTETYHSHGNDGERIWKSLRRFVQKFLL